MYAFKLGQYGFWVDQISIWLLDYSFNSILAQMKRQINLARLDLRQTIFAIPFVCLVAVPEV